MKPITRRRLVDTSQMNLTGEVLPAADDRALTPWHDAPLAPWQPGSAPIINISLPRRTDDTDAAPSMTYERRTLQREPTVETDFLLPTLQAFGVAIALMILAAIASWSFGWGWRVAAISFGIALAIMMIARLRHMDSLLWATETLTGFDVNGDGKVGNPAASFTLANPAQARAEAQREVDSTDAAAARAELLAFLHRCYTVGTAETAHGVKASGPDRQSYVRQRDALLSLGIASWKNPERPKAGWRMAVSYARAQELIARHVL